MVIGLKLMGKLVTSKEKRTKYWIEPKSCMVLGLKPMEKLVTPKEKKKKELSTRQNQSFVWSSDSSLWGN